MSAQPDALDVCSGDHCITCSDEGVAMTVLRRDDGRGLALCEDAAGVHHTVETALLEPLDAGCAVLVHAGVAIARLEPAR